MADGGNILWMASNPMVGFDRNTLAVEYSIPLPNYVHGVSVDIDGYVWGVSMNTEAYRVDPATGTFDTVGGLIGPYTYSDMTGFALSNVGGGGAPSGCSRNGAGPDAQPRLAPSQPRSRKGRPRGALVIRRH